MTKIVCSVHLYDKNLNKSHNNAVTILYTDRIGCMDVRVLSMVIERKKKIYYYVFH